MYTKKTITLFIFFTLLFTGVFFALDTFIFSKKYHPEERLMEESLYMDEKEEVANWDYLQIAKNILKEKTKEEEIKKRIQKRKKIILEHIEEKNKNIEREKIEKELEEKIKKEVEEKQKEIDKMYELFLKNKSSNNNSINNSIKNTIWDDFINEIKVKKIVIPEIEFKFVPNYFSNNSNTWKKDVYKVIDSKTIYNFINELSVIFYENRPDVRGRMKNKSVFLYAPQKMRKDELLAIFIHEFSHYLDIYTFNRSSWEDISNKFYDISWASTKVIKSWLNWKDFVTGYSMTNKYEDFAESLTYYILHNKDFMIKTRDSIVLQKKYNFFKNTLFNSLEFVNTDFSKSNKIKNYYRDITKINFSTKNFLQYLKKSI